MPLVDSLIKEGWLKTPRIIEAFKKIDRLDFVLEQFKDEASGNYPLPIGFSQTISQPATVAFMLELLQPKPKDKVLDVGSGSGWTTALLAYIISQQDKMQNDPEGVASRPYGAGNSKCKIKKGKVVAIEIVPELKELGEKNTGKYSFIEKAVAQFICADGSYGYQKEASFDKILCSASIQFLSNKISLRAQDKIPQFWKEQLKIGGRIVSPIDSSIWLFIKESYKQFKEKEYPGFAFVPLVQNNVKN